MLPYSRMVGPPGDSVAQEPTTILAPRFAEEDRAGTFAETQQVT